MQREYRLLEFDKIREKLAALTVSNMGRELAEDLGITTDLERALRWQQETSEAVSLLTRHSIGLDAVPDLRQSLQMAEKGATLDEGQLFSVLKLLNTATRLKTFFREKEEYPLLRGLVEEMEGLPELRERLREILDEEGQMRDDASPALFRLRRAIAAQERDLRERFERFIRNPANQKLLQESLVTLRGDRFVLPVRQEAKPQVPGIVHDQSASGATLFIEPLWAVEAHKKLALLRTDAERERERILAEMSRWAGAHKEELYLTLNLYAELDFILAKGRLSLAMGAVEPKLNDRGYINIRTGRHPLLTGKVVPINLEMGDKFRTLVITGPNTGGKTVTLKTVGLFSLMAQAGLHVPAAQGTELAVFPRVFADIGDEQNIEQSLSTFSGHLKNIIDIIVNLAPGSLVLLDEVGAGTDPTEGAGLAMSLLEYFHNSRAVTVATTHYSQLKAFAYLTPGMENASVEFDVETLSPTYQLLVGVPGQSNAFAIAEKLGLPGQIIERARTFLSREETKLEEVVADLVASRKRLEITSRQAETDRHDAQVLLAEAKRLQAEVERQKTEILNKAKSEALEIVARARRDSQKLIKELRRLAAAPATAPMQKVEEIKERLDEMDTKLREELEAQRPAEKLAPAEIAPGREVTVISLNQRGVVVQVNEGVATVQIGPMRVNVDIDDLAAARGKDREKQGEYSFALYTKKDVPRELSVRGLALDEAIIRVEDYIQEAVLADVKEFRLIHGKGTGTLRTGLREHLKRHPLVETLRAAHYHEGGTGVTIVRLK